MSRFYFRGQSSFELISIIAILFMIVIAAFGFIQSRTNAVVSDKHARVLEGVANVIRSEIHLAKSVNADYYREFTLPTHIDNMNYSIIKAGESDIVLRIEDTNYVLLLDADFEGEVQKGVNVVRKIGSNITINV